MSTQAELFTYGGHPPFAVGSETSLEAADAIAPTVGTIRAAVLDFIRQRGSYGATHQEVSAHFGGDPNTFHPRVTELKEAGLVVDSGQRRRTRSGRKAAVWRAR